MISENEIISIIIPIFNTDEKLLSICVESAINQTFQNIEIILVDDGSDKRETIEKCQDLLQKDTRVKLITQKNGGESYARKVGLDNANGSFVMFLDSDDCLYSDACEYLKNLISQGNFQIAEATAIEVQEIFTMGRYDENKNYDIIELHGKNTLLEKVIQDCSVPMSWSVWGKIFKTELLKKEYNVYSNIYRGVDVLTLARYITGAENSIHSNKKIYCYNKGNVNSITSKKRNIKNLTMCYMWKEMVNLYKEHATINLCKQVEAIYVNCLVGCMLETMLYKYDGHKLIVKKIRTELKKYKSTIFFNTFMENRLKNIIAFFLPVIYKIYWKIKK